MRSTLHSDMLVIEYEHNASVVSFIGIIVKQLLECLYIQDTIGNFSALHQFKITFLSSLLRLHSVLCSEYTLIACCKLWHKFQLKNYCFT